MAITINHLAFRFCPGQLDGLQEALDVLLGSPHLVLRDLGGGHAGHAWELLICPGDGGVGIEGYRPLASRLTKAGGDLQHPGCEKIQVLISKS